MFKPHQDKLQGANHVRSCVVSLPVKGDCKGGELVIQHTVVAGGSNAEHVVIEHKPPEQDGPIKWHAFFMDLVHHVNLVIQGFCVAMTFHIWQQQRKENGLKQNNNSGIHSHKEQPLEHPLLSPMIESATVDEYANSEVLGQAIEYWLESNFSEAIFVLALNYKYSAGSLAPYHLRG